MAVSSTRTCDKCEKLYSDKYNSCPHCRSPARRNGKWLLVLTTLFIGFIAVRAVFSSDDDSSNTNATADESSTANLSKTSQDNISIVLVGFNAAGCGAIPEDDAETLFTAALESVFLDDKAAGRVVGASYPLVTQAKESGEAEAQSMFGCRFFSSNPGQVGLLRSQVWAAKAYLASAAIMPPDSNLPASEQSPVAQGSISRSPPIASTSTLSADPLVPVSTPQGANSKHSTCDDIMRSGMIANGQEQLCGFTGGIHDKLLQLYGSEGCGSIISTSETQSAAQEVLTGMQNEYAQMGKAAFCKDAEPDYARKQANVNAPK